MSTRAIARRSSDRLGWCGGCDQPVTKPADSILCQDCADDGPLFGTTRRVRSMSPNRYSRRGR